MIEVKNISKEFKVPIKGKGLSGTFKSLFKKEYQIIKAVDDVSFSIGEGEIIGYIGANGAGKSTTIKMMTGILVPTSGECLVNGIVPYEKRSENAMKIGVVFGQRTQLWWDLPLGETFGILKEIYKVSDDDFNERYAYLNEVLDLESFSSKPVRTLSLGQRMRADLAASMIHNPKVLYLDEPTIGLDVIVKEKIREAIKLLNQKFKTTVILTTHDMSDIEELCSRMIIIDKGRKIYDGDLQQIKEKYGNLRTISLDLKNPENDVQNEIQNYFGLDSDSINASFEESNLSITFDRNIVKLPQIMDFVLHKYDVLDFSIKETAIEDIVKRIYRNELDLVGSDASKMSV